MGSIFPFVTGPVSAELHLIQRRGPDQTGEKDAEWLLRLHEGILWTKEAGEAMGWPNLKDAEAALRMLEHSE